MLIRAPWRRRTGIHRIEPPQWISIQIGTVGDRATVSPVESGTICGVVAANPHGKHITACRTGNDHPMPPTVAAIVALVGRRMVGKILVASVAATLALPLLDRTPGATPYRIGRCASPFRSSLRTGSHYAAAVQTGVYDSCWRYRVIMTRWGRDVRSCMDLWQPHHLRFQL